jgi:IS1 family transposase
MRLNFAVRRRHTKRKRIRKQRIFNLLYKHPSFSFRCYTDPLTKQRRQMRANPHHLEQLGHGQQQGNVELIPPGEDRSDRSDIIYLTGNGGGPPGPKSGQGLDATLDGLGLLEPFGIRRYYTDYWGAYRRHLDADKHQPGKRQTQQAERKHLTLRTRIKRLTRRTICFSKSIQMHDIVIGLFVNRYEFGLLI